YPIYSSAAGKPFPGPPDGDGCLGIEDNRSYSRWPFALSLPAVGSWLQGDKIAQNRFPFATSRFLLASLAARGSTRGWAKVGRMPPDPVPRSGPGVSGQKHRAGVAPAPAV